MHSNAARKQAIRLYKERKPVCGAFAVRCTATGRIWVGSTPNLDTIKNRFWFGLRLGTHPDQALQNEWNAYGEHTFQYEILQKLDDPSPLELKDLLKEAKRHWIEQLGGLPA